MNQVDGWVIAFYTAFKFVELVLCPRLAQLEPERSGAHDRQGVTAGT